MTQKQSTQRMLAYIFAAMLSTGGPMLALTDFSNWKQVGAFVSAVTVAAIIAWRSYVDQTPSRVDPPQ